MKLEGNTKGPLEVSGRQSKARLVSTVLRFYPISFSCWSKFGIKSRIKSRLGVCYSNMMRAKRSKGC